jgi:hypothetical protein
LIHYKELKHDVKYIIYVNLKHTIATFQYIESYHGDIKRAIFLSERGYSIIVPFISLINALEISSLEAELL